MVVQENNNNMERLTIKELSPYLPYGLIVMGNIHGIDTECCLTTCNIESHIKGQSKPLLRPLSSLTEEVYWKLSGADKNRSFGFRYGKYNGNSDKRDFISHSGYSERKYFLEDGYGQFPYRMMEFFLKHHFDVFNLIPNNLAIPIDGKEVKGE